MLNGSLGSRTRQGGKDKGHVKACESGLSILFLEEGSITRWRMVNVEGQIASKEQGVEGEGSRAG